MTNYKVRYVVRHESEDSWVIYEKLENGELKPYSNGGYSDEHTALKECTILNGFRRINKQEILSLYADI